MAVPIRTCIGCRRRDAAAEMVRLRLRVQPGQRPGGEAGQVEVVVAESSAGRGASLHAQPACLDKGLRPDVLSRAFKRRVTVRDTTELLQRITIASRRKR
jgi:predicted RNA-binding protein YlxR (DUF448 family)